MSVTDSWRVTGVSRPLGAQRVDIGKRLAQHISVEEENGIEGLVLSAGCNISVPGEVSQECF